MRLTKRSDEILLIEATSNQVNQFGGYTGMRPPDFRDMVFALAKEEGLSRQNILLGGDHLGPHPWSGKPAQEAMALAAEMIAEYAKAGFQKFHLDTSMPCSDDPRLLPDSIVAERAALLCEIVEQYRGNTETVYIVGTEVPTPGGATESLDDLHVTTALEAERTIVVHQDAFTARGLQSAWQRVVGIVVQPGVEFNHDDVVEYAPAKAVALKGVLQRQQDFVFEAHSTDYQQPQAYRELVRDGFRILKVGPALTFSMREALFALAAIECELFPKSQISSLPGVIEEEMLKDPSHWQHHYHGNLEEQHILRRYSYSDRIRYYWNVPEVESATKALIENLSKIEIPETMLSQYLPEQYQAYREGKIDRTPFNLVMHHIESTLLPYAESCRVVCR
jgi:D-tagatose-1,6-bisphosphate aldolase subunit GatZ/KbaZ